jgi:Ca2+-binding EF-hand superfamily protein
MYDVSGHASLALCALCFLASAALPLPAAADSATGDSASRAISEFLDANGDGRISYEEFVHSVAVKAMREMDADKNGVLTPSEVTRGGPPSDAPVPTIKFGEIDTNGDGWLSRVELETALRDNASVRVRFRNLDWDQDGFLSQYELYRSFPGAKVRVVPEIVIPVQ